MYILFHFAAVCQHRINNVVMNSSLIVMQNPSQSMEDCCATGLLKSDATALTGYVLTMNNHDDDNDDINAL